MTTRLVDRIPVDEPRLERIRSLIAGTDRNERSLRIALVLVHEAVRSSLAAATETAVSLPWPRFDPERLGIDSRERIRNYEALVERVRERTRTIVPSGAQVAMVSRGDDHLLTLEGRVAVHFPQDKTGRYAGYYPEGAGQAIQQLLELKGRGIQFVVFPATAFWWFEFYSDMTRWLAPALAWSCEDCAVFELARIAGAEEGAA
jgi:hypothetical protein